MPLMRQEASLQMEWCINCHRNPEQYVRPRDQVFSVDYQPPSNQAELGARLVEEYQIQKLTSCSTCHR
jgi:cytochrome c553